MDKKGSNSPPEEKGGYWEMEEDSGVLEFVINLNLKIIMNNLRIKSISTFIKKIRDCNDIDLEKQIVEKKLNKIRTKFMKSSSNSDNKKYLWQLAFAQLIGYIIDFGYTQINQLVQSLKYSEKYTGYVTATFMIPPDELDTFSILLPAVKNDLYSKSQQVQSLALNLIGVTAQKTLVQNLKVDILKLALGDSNEIQPDTRKKALFCLLRIYRQYKQALGYDVKKWIQPLTFMLQKYSGNYSVILAILTLIEGILQIEYSKNWDDIAVEVLKVLQKLIITEGCPSEYQYYTVTHPWVQIKALKILSTMQPCKDPSFKPILS